MSFIRFLASERHTYIILVILSLSKIMSIYSRYIKKKLVCIIITALFSCQFSFYLKYTKLNIHLSCNVKLVLNIKYL